MGDGLHGRGGDQWRRNESADDEETGNRGGSAPETVMDRSMMYNKSQINLNHTLDFWIVNLDFSHLLVTGGCSAMCHLPKLSRLE